jgi:hypothetical protein
LTTIADKRTKGAGKDMGADAVLGDGAVLMTARELGIRRGRRQ